MFADVSEFPKAGDSAIFKATGEVVMVIGFQEAHYRTWVIEQNDGKRRLCTKAALEPVDQSNSHANLPSE